MNSPPTNIPTGCHDKRNHSEIIIAVGIISAILCLLYIADPYNKILAVVCGATSTYLWSKYRGNIKIETVTNAQHTV
jgi:hypothetical protein